MKNHIIALIAFTALLLTGFKPNITIEKTWEVTGGGGSNVFTCTANDNTGDDKQCFRFEANGKFMMRVWNTTPHQCGNHGNKPTLSETRGIWRWIGANIIETKSPEGKQKWQVSKLTNDTLHIIHIPQ